jgi:hypothetical protein
MINVSQSASITVNGITPAAGPGLTLLANPQLATANVSMGDYFANTFTINPNTAATVLSIGSIVTAKMLWVKTDQPIQITLTQNSIDKDFAITDFVMINATFTQLKLANSSTTAPAHVAVVATGDRAIPIPDPNVPIIF